MKKVKENADEEFIKYLEDRGLLNDYLREPEHKTIDQEKIEKLDNGAKSFLDKIEDSYKKGELSKEEYEQISAAIIEGGVKNQKDLMKTKGYLKLLIQ